MPWWFDLVLLTGGVALLWNSRSEPDDVWRLLQMLLGAVAMAVVLLSGRQVLLELLALSLALWLPSSTCPHLWSRDGLQLPPEPDPQQRRRSVRGSSSAIAPSPSRGG